MPDPDGDEDASRAGNTEPAGHDSENVDSVDALLERVESVRIGGISSRLGGVRIILDDAGQASVAKDDPLAGEIAITG